MARQRRVYRCTNCGLMLEQWIGRCPQCGEWNTIVEDTVDTVKDRSTRNQGIVSSPIPFNVIDTAGTISRTRTGISELDRVLGGGIVRGSFTLVGGDPGIGKSTILLQMANNVASNDVKVLYISGEESAEQLKMRGERLGIDSEDLLVYPEVVLENIREQILSSSPEIVIIDSIQSILSTEIDAPPGSIAQIRNGAGTLLEIAKGMNVTVFVVGHVTKDGWIAGPKMLEHLVDTVLYFEGDSSGAYRVLRTVKNRFGPTGEIGVFEMKADGLKEVKDPSHLFIHGHGGNLPGAAVMATIEGTRALLVEVQSLVSRSSFSMPRRISIGIDMSRLSVLLAVLEKRGGLKLSSSDVVVSVAGGIKVVDPAIDLSIIMAVASSAMDKPVPRGMVFIGEVGLNGEIRAVNRIDARVNEAKRMGFSRVAIPSSNSGSLEDTRGIKILPISSIRQAFGILGKQG
ncbi:MAG: DNA repair protein RadA [Deltaproteobacteria bacterium]|nr:DNA repair protein RadA [Deltaproteobacteria bacterium]